MNNKNDKDYDDNEYNKNNTYEKNNWNNKNKHKHNNKENDKLSIKKLITLFYCPH